MCSLHNISNWCDIVILALFGACQRTAVQISSGPLLLFAYAKNFTALTRLAVKLHLLEIALFPLSIDRVFIQGRKRETGSNELCAKERLFYHGAYNPAFNV
jgi:hypothetical protein